MNISIVIPICNEEENIGALYSELTKCLSGLALSYEIIIVDDGSKDASSHKLKELAAKDNKVKIITLRRNFGQTAAIVCGFDHAKGDFVITMDGDLQNDPQDIPALLKKIQEGYDLVGGWRKDRKDSFLRRKLPSFLANWLIVKFTGVKLHDYGCTLKVYRREFLKDIYLYGEMHRFIPVYFSVVGGRITELKVNHRPRTRGSSKYGIERTMKVFFDLLTVKLLCGSSSTSPLYFFGRWGIGLIVSGILCATVALAQKILYGFWVHKNPLLLLAVFFILMGSQAIFMGLLAEINIRIYYESTKKSIYSIAEIINL